MPKILIAVDDTEHSLRAACTARSLFGDDAEYFVITVLASPAVMWGGGEAMRWGVAYPAAVPAAAMAMPYPLVIGSGAADPETQDPEVRKRVDEAEQAAEHVAEAAHLPTATALGDIGDPAPAIIAAAEKHDVDAIVVGSSHAGWISRLITRPIPDDVLRNADRAVLVVP